MSANPSIERTVTSGLRPLVTAAHVKRWASPMPAFVWRLGLLLALAVPAVLAGCANPGMERSSSLSCSPTWHLVYRHDADARLLAGSKKALFDAVRSGAPLRVAWGVRVERDNQVFQVEHSADPVFVSLIADKEVVVQLPEHIAQRSYADPSNIAFEKASVMWRGLMSTDGTFDALWVNRATGEEIRRVPQKVALAWFAFLPPEGCARQPPLDLALPGGVRRAVP